MVVLALLAGLALMAVIVQDAFEVMLLPRRVIRRWRLVRAFFRTTWTAWASIGRALPAGPGRERFLSIYGPLSMALLFSLWAAGLILAFALVQWALQFQGGHGPDFGQQVYFSGVTFFTLGYGDVVLAKPWRLLGPIEGLMGVLMCGLSTGFFFVIVSRLHQSRPEKSTAVFSRE